MHLALWSEEPPDPVLLFETPPLAIQAVPDPLDLAYAAQVEVAEEGTADLDGLCHDLPPRPVPDGVAHIPEISLAVDWGSIGLALVVGAGIVAAVNYFIAPLPTQS